MLYLKKTKDHKSRAALITLLVLAAGLILQPGTGLMARGQKKRSSTGKEENSTSRETKDLPVEKVTENLFIQEHPGQELSIVPPQENDADKTFTKVDVLPEFPGGAAALMKFLSVNIRYPAAARKANVQGRVVCKFVVNREGKIENVQILKGIHPDCDAETVRVLKAMPAWKPGEQNDSKVKVYYTLPIAFRLTN